MFHHGMQFQELGQAGAREGYKLLELFIDGKFLRKWMPGAV